MAGTAPAPAIEEALRAAAQEGRQLYLGTRVARLAEPPSPAAFLRDWVGPRRPCVVRGALEGWACVKDGRWGRAAYLRERLAGRTVTISLTPDGRADAVRRFAAGGGGVTLPPGAAGGAGSREYFVLPDDHKMEIGAFLEHLREGGRGGGGGGHGAYAQCQNSSLKGEFRDLLDDAAPDVGFATAALGRAPEAVNLWIGDARSETSFHQDPYENVLCVVEGEKTVTLLPPHEGHRCYAQEYPVAQYSCDLALGSWRVAPQDPPASVAWSPIDPHRPDATAFPRYFGPGWPEPLKVTVGKGECLYLPALWWHYVEQRGSSPESPCISVNFWYDMVFDDRALLNDLVGAVLQAAPPTMAASEARAQSASEAAPGGGGAQKAP